MTFDDGPTNFTSGLLDVLKKYDVKATFFVSANYSNYIGLIKRAYDEGHSIGVHSYSHNYYVIYSDSKLFFNDINKVNDIIERYTGKRSTLYRFPGGSLNSIAHTINNNIIDELKLELESKGFVYFDWNVSSGDNGGTNTELDFITNNMINGILKHPQSIVLCHDTYKNIIPATETVIKWGIENDYEFKTLTPDGFKVQFNSNHGSKTNSSTSPTLVNTN